MPDAMPALPLQQKVKRWSIKTKILLALLTLSLSPLILLVVVNRARMVDVQDFVKSQLIREAHRGLLQLTKDQASIASAMLDKIATETRMVAFFSEALLRDAKAVGRARSYSADDKPDDSNVASKYTLAPGVSMDAAEPELDLTSKLDKLFALIKAGDPRLEAIYYGTQSGGFLIYPGNYDTRAALQFTLEPAFAQYLNEGGKASEPLLQAFSKNGAPLSSNTEVLTTQPGKEWTISDGESKRIFSVRQVKTGLSVVYLEYDPRNRPWYLNAIGRNSEVWSKYADWSGGKFLFTIAAELESQIADTISPSIVRAFRDKQITLVDNATVSIGDNYTWRLQDENRNNYQIRKENDKLNVYDTDVLTCSRAVLDPEGRLAGVVGLDINMGTITTEVIHTPDEIAGDAFLLNERGELIDQETADMFIPRAGNSIRSKMAAGDIGDDYDSGSATHVAYAPIRPIHSPDEKSFWSLGISMPERDITQLADDIHRKLVSVLEVVVGFFAVMIILVIFAAMRISKGITGPIVALDAGVTRIGGGDLDYRVDVRTRDEIEELADAFNKMAGDLQAYIKNLRETTAEKERFESELRVAHDIQMSFLKKIFPPFPHRSDVSLYAAIETAREVGGDLYDFGIVDASRLVFYVGDVSDKGVPASLVMAMTMTLMRRASEEPGIAPSEILRQVNVALSQDNENCMFVTLFIGILNLQTGELRFSNAGHNPPLILGADGEVRCLTLPDGLVLGVMTEAEYHDDTVRLESGDTIVAYTDGVTEAMSPGRILYSDARLRETLANLSGRSVEDTVRNIFASVRVHAAGAPQSDDIAVLALRRS